MSSFQVSNIHAQETQIEMPLRTTWASIEAGGTYALAFASGLSTTATALQSLGSNAHIISVKDVYGGTFRYMRRVAAESQGLETTFLDLENASDNEFISSIRDNTKVFMELFFPWRCHLCPRNSLFG